MPFQVFTIDGVIDAALECQVCVRQVQIGLFYSSLLSFFFPSFPLSRFFFFFFFLQNTGLIQTNQGRKESSPRSMFGMPMDMSDTSDY